MPSELDDKWWRDLERETGALDPSQRAWILDLVAGARKGIKRVGRKEVLAALAPAKTTARGRPRKAEMPPRVRRYMSGYLETLGARLALDHGWEAVLGGEAARRQASDDEIEGAKAWVLAHIKARALDTRNDHEFDVRTDPTDEQIETATVLVRKWRAAGPIPDAAKALLSPHGSVLAEDIRAAGWAVRAVVRNSGFDSSPEEKAGPVAARNDLRDPTFYFVCHTLAAAWGRGKRLRTAKGVAMPHTHEVKISRNARAEAGGPFVRALILIMRAGGREHITADIVQRGVNSAREAFFAA